jgi:hypothetical protein
MAHQFARQVFGAGLCYPSASGQPGHALFHRVAPASAVALTALAAGPAWAADFLVTNEAQLAAAITSAINGDRIIFNNSITLTANLPPVQASVTFLGNSVFPAWKQSCDAVVRWDGAPPRTLEVGCHVQEGRARKGLAGRRP